ncbi:MAG: FG-GAP-like repeat-containing protein [Planctomycetota bacterium JB042]
MSPSSRFAPFALLPFLAGAPWPAASAQEVVHRIDGAFGEAVGGASDAIDDVDGDGVPDFVIGPAGQGSVTIRSGKTAEAVVSIPVGSGFSDLATGGDLDGDGIEDVVVGFGLFASSNHVAVHSGKDGSLLLSVPADGFRVAGAGDVDADGTLALVAAGRQIPPVGGVIVPIETRVVSGASGAFLHAFSSAPTLGGGAHVAAAGDVDHDGFDDVLLGNSPFASLGLPPTVDAVSGKTGAVLSTSTGEIGSFLVHLDSVGDRDGDGVAEHARVLFRLESDGTRRPRFEFADGATGALSFAFEGEKTFGPGDGVSVGAVVGDVDGDAWADVAFGLSSTQPGTGAGWIEVFSGADGDLLFALAGDGDEDVFGVSVSTAGDLDGDGRSELIAGAAGSAPEGSGSVSRVVRSLTMTTGSADGCVGSGGVAPRLRTSGSLAVGTPESLRVKDALGGSLAWFLVGTGPAAVDLGAGCTLAVALSPAVLNSPFAVSPGRPGAGETEWVETVPAQASGFLYRAQGFVLDAGSPLGFSATGAIDLVVP